MANKRGRPTIFTSELADRICAELETGRTLIDVCRDEGMPVESAVRKWAAEDRDGFYAKYARAREVGYHRLADELIEIADDGTNDWVQRRGDTVLDSDHVQRSRLRVDTRKWLLSKALPKIYGDKLQHTGPDGNEPVKIERIERVIIDSPSNQDG